MVSFEGKMDKSVIIRTLKDNLQEKWQRRYTNSEKVNIIQEYIEEVGKRSLSGKGDREAFGIINQLICGHTNLNEDKPPSCIQYVRNMSSNRNHASLCL